VNGVGASDVAFAKSSLSEREGDVSSTAGTNSRVMAGPLFSICRVGSKGFRGKIYGIK
jgi:hypothetical protein